MIRIRYTLLLGAFIALYCCQPGRTKLKFTTQEKSNFPAWFKKYQSTVILKEDNIRMMADRYALSSLEQMDSTILTSVPFPFPGTNGKFSKLEVRKGEQYHIILPGKDRVFVNAGTQLLMNFQEGRKYYILHGKTWFKSEQDSAIIQADSFIVNLSPRSKVNIDNYASDSDIIISLTEGTATIIHRNKSHSLIPGWEIVLKRATGKLITKMSPVDVTSWTVGGFRRWDLNFSSIMNEIGRLYDKEVYIDKIDETTHGLNLDYRNYTVEQVVNIYDTTLPSVRLQLCGDSLKVCSRPAMKKKKVSSRKSGRQQ
jgi:hypothetical protein